MSLFPHRGSNAGLSRMLPKVNLRSSLVFGIIILVALVAFELFNFSTTEFALSDLLGDLVFAGIRWSTILSIAFCGIDFAGIARLFTPQQGNNEPTEVWYLFGAWLLAATMNAILTWWGVSMAVANHSMQSTAVIGTATLTRIVPIFVAIMVWLIRILIIGSLSYTGDKLFWQADRTSASTGQAPIRNLMGNSTPPAGIRSAPKPVARPEGSFNRSEPTYHSASMSSSGSATHSGIREPSKPETRR
jgi:hypothetical protein